MQTRASCGTWEPLDPDSTGQIGILPTNGYPNKTQMSDSVRGQHLSLGGTMVSRHWHRDSIQPLLTTSNRVYQIAEECFFHKVKMTPFRCSS